uniref:Uncharacterized protein n=2 Tax=Hemiselmis andersenii TaxID=464988 RepID=A0A6T8NGZ4_HEMAN
MGQGIGRVHFALLVFWVFICGFVREGKTPYGGFVAQLTPFIMVEVPEGQYGGAAYESWALTRITQNMLAVLVFVAVELVVLPAMSSMLIKWRVVKDFRFAAAAARATWDAEMQRACDACRSKRAEAAAKALKSLQSGLDTQKELLEEARTEPDWYCWADSHLENYDALIKVQTQDILPLLKLMYTSISRASLVPDQTTHGDAESYHKLVALLRPEAKRIRRSVCGWLESLARDIDEGITAGHASVIEEEAVRARIRFENEVFASVVKVRSGKKDPFPTELFLPLYAFIYCTREIVTALQEVSRQARGLCEYSPEHIAFQSTSEWRDELQDQLSSDTTEPTLRKSLERKSREHFRKSHEFLRRGLHTVRLAGGGEDHHDHMAEGVGDGACEMCGAEVTCTPMPVSRQVSRVDGGQGAEPEPVSANKE